MTALLLLLACASSDFAMQGERDSDSAPFEGTDSGADPEAAELWSLAAELDLVDGVPSAGTFTVELLGGSTDESCPLPDPVPFTAGQSPHPAIFSWWSAPLLTHDGPGCDVLPESVWIGLGALDETLEASLPGAGIETATSAGLNGAYLSEDDGETIWVFGVAGPATTFSNGGEAPAYDATEMNGHWSIVPVFDLPLP